MYVASLSSGRIFKISDGTSSSATTSLTPNTIDILTNPLSNTLQWRMNAEYKGDITWNIYDLQGKIIKTVQTQKNEDTQVYTADVSQLPIGEYLLKNNVDASTTKRIIKI